MRNAPRREGAAGFPHLCKYWAKIVELSSRELRYPLEKEELIQRHIFKENSLLLHHCGRVYYFSMLFFGKEAFQGNPQMQEVNFHTGGEAS